MKPGPIGGTPGTGERIDRGAEDDERQPGGLGGDHRPGEDEVGYDRVGGHPRELGDDVAGVIGGGPTGNPIPHLREAAHRCPRLPIADDLALQRAVEPVRRPGPRHVFGAGGLHLRPENRIGQHADLMPAATERRGDAQIRWDGATAIGDGHQDRAACCSSCGFVSAVVDGFYGLAYGERGLFHSEAVIAAQQAPGRDVGGNGEPRQTAAPGRAGKPFERGRERTLHPLAVELPTRVERVVDRRDAFLDRQQPHIRVEGRLVIGGERLYRRLDIANRDGVPELRGPGLVALSRARQEDGFLRTEVVDDRLRRDAGRRGDLPHPDIVVRARDEEIERRVEDPLTGGLRRCGPCRH